MSSSEVVSVRCFPPLMSGVPHLPCGQRASDAVTTTADVAIRTETHDQQSDNMTTNSYECHDLTTYQPINVDKATSHRSSVKRVAGTCAARVEPALSLSGRSRGLGRGGGLGMLSISSIKRPGVCRRRERHAANAGSCSSRLHRFG